MADPPRYPDSNDDTHSTPRWVKVFGMITVVVVLLILVLLLTRGPGGHGPQRHFSSGDASLGALLSVAEHNALSGGGPG